MKIVLKQEDSDYLSTLDKEIQDALAGTDLNKMHSWLLKNYDKLKAQTKNDIVFSQLLNNLDNYLETSLSEYKVLITQTDNALSTQKPTMESIETKIFWILKVFTMLLQKVDCLNLFSSFERIIEILPLANDLKLIKKALDVLELYFTGSRLRRNQLVENKEKLARMVHNISMIALHANLYNRKTWTLLELLSDDPKFKDYNIRQGEKLTQMKYYDILEFEYYIPLLLRPQEEGSIPIQGVTEPDNDNIRIYIESLKAQYPGETHYSICKKIVKEKRLNIEEGAPIFDALLFRIRTTQDFDKYEKRLAIIETVLSAIATLGAIRKDNGTFKRYESYIYQNRDFSKTVEEISDLLNLQASSSLHKKVIKLLINIAHQDIASKYRSFFSVKFGHTGDLYLALRDLTSLELKASEKKDAQSTEEASVNTRSLILSRETIVKSSVLYEMLRLIQEVLEDYYFEDRRRQLSPDVESLSHIVSSIMNLLTSSGSGKNFFLYSKKNVLYALKIIKMLIFYKDFVREFRIIETLVESGENLFKVLNEQKKCLIYKKGNWEPLPENEVIDILVETLGTISYYFYPMGRYASRAEMATTIARKVAESGIMKCSVAYLRSGKEINPELFREIMRIVSEVCRESQTLVPRMVESGILELILKRVKETFAENEDIGDAIQLVSNICMQDVGSSLERKFKIVEMFFESFTNIKYDDLNQKWYKAENKPGVLPRVGQLDRVERELVHITKYVNGYNTIVSEGINNIANLMVSEGQDKLKELGILSGKSNATEEDKKKFEEMKERFANYIYKLHNFLGIYGRYLREPRLRDVLFREGGFKMLTRLLSLHQIFFADYQLNQSKTMDFWYAIIEKELENPDTQIVKTLEKLLSEELDGIEKLAGPLNKLKDFSGLMDESMCTAFSKKTILEGLLGAKEGAPNVLRFMASTCLISMMVNIFVSYKLGSQDVQDRLFLLYGVYSNTLLHYNLAQTEKVFEDNEEQKSEEKGIEDKERRIKFRINTILNERIDVLSKGHPFMMRIKGYLDQAVVNDAVGGKKQSVIHFANIALQTLAEFKDLKEPPKDLEGKIIYTVKVQAILNTLYLLIHNTNNKQKIYQTAFPAFTFVLYEEGAFEVLAEKLLMMVQFGAEELNKEGDGKDSEEGVKRGLLQKCLGTCVERVIGIYEKFFLPPLDQNLPTTFKDKVIQKVELAEYINCVWLGHVKLMLPFFDVISDVCKKIGEFKLKKREKKEEGKEEGEPKKAAAQEKPQGEEQDKEKEKKLEQERKEKELEKMYGVNKRALRQFVDMFFKNLARVFTTNNKPAQAVPGKLPEEKKDKAAEKVVNDLCDMGFSRKAAELATKNIPHMNIALAIDWITSHSQEVEKAEREGAASKPAGKAEEKPEEISLGATKLGRVTNEELFQAVAGTLQEFSDRLISNLFSYEGYEKGIIKFIRKSIDFHEKNNKKGYTQRIAIIVLKLFKGTVNHYFKNAKYISSFKVPKTLDKDIGQDVLKSYSVPMTTYSGRLRNLELALLWFIKLKSFIPNFEKNFLRSDFLTELMNFYEAVLSHGMESISNEQSSEEAKQAFGHLRKVNQYMLRIFNTIFSLKQNPIEPESSDKKVDKSIGGGGEEERKSAVSASASASKEGKVPRKGSFRYKKTPIEVLVNIVSTANVFYTKNKLFLLLNDNSLRNVLELLSAFLNENSDNIKQFLKLNGLTEMLKVKAESLNPSQFLNDLAVLFMNLVEEPSLVMATLEARVKSFMSRRLKQNPDLSVADFINQLKNLYPRNRKLLVEVIQRFCVIYAKEPDPVPPKEKKKKLTKKKSATEQEVKEEKPKEGQEKEKDKVETKTTKVAATTTAATKTNPTDIIQRRFIKLKDSAEIGKIEGTKKAGDKKRKSVEEVDLGETTQNIVYTPSQNVTQVLNTLLESIVLSFNKKIAESVSQGKELQEESSNVFPYNSLIKVLGLICTEHPLLLPTVLNYNCAHLVSKDKELPVLKRCGERTTFTFLSYYLRVINYITLDKLRYFLVAIASVKDILIQKSEGSLVSLGEEVAREIVNEMKAVLQDEVSRPDFLDTADSIQSVCSVSSLLITLLPVRQILKIIMEKDTENKKEPEIMRLYVDALKRLRLKDYYRLENVLPYLIEPCSALIHYHNHIVLGQTDLNASDKYVAGNILVKSNFREVWEQLLASQNDLENQQEGGQDRGRQYEDPYGRSYLPRLMGFEEEMDEDDDGGSPDINLRGNLFRLAPDRVDLDEFEESSEGEGDLELVMPYVPGAGEDWQVEDDQSLGSDEVQEQGLDDGGADLVIEIVREGNEDNEESQQEVDSPESGLIIGRQQIEGQPSSIRRALEIGERLPEEAEEGDYDEDMNEKSGDNIPGVKRDKLKRQSFAPQIQALLEEGNVHDADLRNINNLFVELYSRIEEPKNISLTTNNPVQYKLGTGASRQTGDLNVYRRLYQNVVADRAGMQSGDLNRAGSGGYNIELDRDRLSIRGHLDDLRRDNILRMVEEGMNEGWDQGTLYQNILSRYGMGAMGGLGRRYVGGLGDHRDRGQLFDDGRNQARVNQQAVSSEDTNSFIVEMFRTVEQNIPQPPVPENPVAEEEEEEEVSEEEAKAETEQNQNQNQAEKAVPKTTGQAPMLSAEQLASIFQSVTANLGLGQATGNTGAAGQNQQPAENVAPVEGDRPQSPRLQQVEERKEVEPQAQVEGNQAAAATGNTTTEARAQPEEAKEEVRAQDLGGMNEGGSTFRLSDYGIDQSFLESLGIDMTVFEILPDEEKLDLVLSFVGQEGGAITGNQNTGASGTSATQAQGQAQSQEVNLNNLGGQPPVGGNDQGNAAGQLQEESKASEQAGASGQTGNVETGAQQAAAAGASGAGGQQGESGSASAQQGGAQQANVIPGIDPEILANLDQFPEDVRMDILQQQNQMIQQNMRAGGTVNAFGMDMDIATFIETLDPALRQDILATSDQSLIDSLPSHLAAEAQIIRDNRMNRFENEGLQQNRFEGNNEIPLNFIEKSWKKEKKPEGLVQEKREKLFESNEKLIESLLKLLYLEPSKFSHFPFDMLVALSQHPRNEFKIFDTLMFLLRNTAPQEKGEDHRSQEGEDGFPPKALYEKNRIIKDKETVYRQVSPHILFLLYCLTQTKSDYFVEDRDKEGSLETLSVKRNDSLGSIQSLRAEMQIRESHPLYDLLKLCSNEMIIRNPANVNLLTSIIENICKNEKIFKTITQEEEEEVKEGDEKEEPQKTGEEEEKKEVQGEDKKKKEAPKKEKEEIYMCKYKLDEQSVASFCKLLYSDNLNNTVISKLSFIIGVFCQEKHNLDLFIKVMKEMLYKVSLESNRFLEQKIDQLKNLGGQVLEQNDEQMQAKVKSLLNEVVVKFGNQVLILRIAKIIKFLYENTVRYLRDKHNYDLKVASKKNQKEKEKEKEEDNKAPRKGSLKDELFIKAKEEIMGSLETIMLDDNLKAFWINVSECVHLINERLMKNWDIQNLLNVNVRPIIESFFIIHKILNDEEYTEYAKTQNKPTKVAVIQTVTTELDTEAELEQAPLLGRGFSEMRNKKWDPNEMFAFICEKNKKVINNMIKLDFNLLNDSMSMIAKKVPKILDFEIRRAYFRKELSKMQKPGTIRLRVKRRNLMENSFNQVHPRTADELKRKLHVEFIGEEGMDAGGVSREWFLELSKQVFNANYNLFVPSANGNTFQPSEIADPQNLNYFKFIGKFIAKALFDKQLLECYFTRSFYKHILGQPINYHDIEDIDPEYYKSLKWILENDISQALLDLTFSYEYDKFGQRIVEDLIPNGRNIPVTEANKTEYVHLICNQKMARGIKAQVESFLSGFFELIPKNLIAIFDSKELELLISGLPDIDIIDLRENTDYHGYDSNSQIIKWYWEILEEMDHTQRANLLQFVTGTSKVPLEGFKALRGISGLQKFQIHKAGNPKALPTGHTCFNQLDLPEYKSLEELRNKLLLAITEGKEGFGFA